MKPDLHRRRDLLDDESDAGGLRLERDETLQLTASDQGEAAWPALLFTHPVPPQAVAPSLAPVIEPLAGAAPVASNVSAVGFRNKALNGFLKASDAEGDALSYTILTQPTQGSVVHNGSGSFTYTPPNGFNGTTSFTFRANDGTTNSNTATVTITVSNTTAPAITEADINAETYSNDLRADALLGFAPDWNLLLPARAKLFYTFDTTYGGGSASSSGRTGAVAAFNATQQAAATAILAHVTAVTGIPFELTNNSTEADIHFGAANVDFQPDDADDTIAGICLNSWGWSTSGGNVTSFNAESIVLLDNVQFAAENAAPAAGNDGYQILLHEIGHALGLGHPFENPDPSKRLAPGNDNTDNTVMSYTWTGATKSIFQSYDLLALRWIYGEDGLAGTWGFNSSYGPSLTLVAPNSAPTSASTSVNATEDQTLNGQLPAATDVDGQAITYSRVSNPSHGSATVNANGSYSYVPAANYNGGDSFDFRVTDTLGAFNDYTVTITVAAVNDAPVLANAIADQNATAGAAFGFAFASNTFSDVDGQALTYTAQLQGGGALPAWLGFNGAARSFSGTPLVANVGTLTVQVTASDGSLTASDLFTLTVAAAPNQPPVAANTTVNATEDQTLNGNLPAATDGNGDPITYARTTNATHGTATVNANGSFSYSPAADYNGSDSFGFSVSDNHGGSNSYTVTVTVAAVNDAPVLANAIADQNATAGAAFGFAFASNTFSDVDGQALTYTALLQGGGALPAWLSFNSAARSFSGTPLVANVGTLTVQVTASDGSLTASDLFTITVAAAPNQPPVAANTTVNATEDQTLAGNLPAATDGNGDPITYARTTNATHGTATVNANGSFSYTPAADYNGSDSFGFSVSDNHGGSNSYTVTVNVAAVNDAPVLALAIPDQNATAGTAFAFTIAANAFTDIDSNTLTHSATLQSGAALPAWLAFTPATRSFSGTATNGDAGTLAIRVTASDGSLTANDVFSLVVAQLNLPPVAADASVNATEDQLLAGQLPAASDPNGDPVVYARATQAAHGTAVVNANGSFSYTPVADYFGSDSFSYRVSDALGASNTYTVSVSVAPLNDAPVAQDASATTAEDQPLEGSAQADDIDSQQLEYTLVSGPAHGTLQLQLGGAWRYVPAADFHGSDSFVFRASDGALNSAPATVSLTVTPVNDAPTATGASVSTPEDTPLDGALQASDIDSAVLTVIVITQPQHGTLELLDGLNYRFRPAPEFNGGDSFRFVVRDGALDSAIVTQSIAVTPVNDAPRVPANINEHAIEDATATGTLSAADIDGPTLTFQLVAPPAHGTLQFEADGKWSYTPERNFASLDQFSYRASDGLASSAVGLVSFAVQNINDLATGGLVIVGEALVGQSLSVLSSVRDIDGLAAFSYRWLRVAADGQSEPVGATAGYTPVAADIGQRLRVEVNFVDGGGTAERVFSALSGTIGEAATATGTTAGERLTGSALPDFIDGGDGNDTLIGAAANDTLIGGTGNDSVDGGAGFDTLSYRGRSDAVVASLAGGTASIASDFDLFDGIEALIGGNGNDQLDGDDLANRLDGEAGNDAMRGGPGDDTLAAGAGNDTLDGGAGSDTADYDGLSGALLIDLPTGGTRGGGKEDLLLSIEHARGGWGDDSLIGGDGSQRLDGNAGDDSINAGDDNDVLIGGLGRDTLDGGVGFDVVIYRGDANVGLDLRTGIVFHQGDEDMLVDIEAAVGGSGDDFLVGRDDTGAGIAQLFRGGAGNDVIDGRDGVDQAQFSFPYAEYQVHRVDNEISVGHIPSILQQPGGDGLDTLANIERLLFADRYIAFGARAEEVARVAFVLWSPAISFSTALFARGISFYDVGYDFRTLVETALLFHPDSDVELAAKLVVHTPGTTTTAQQLLELMQANGGGTNGRIAAVSQMANDVRTGEQVALAGFITHGVPCDLNFGETVLFAQLPVG